jgi:hypothetical protein
MTSAPPEPSRPNTLGIDTSQVTEQDDVGYINRILAPDADDAIKKAELLKLLEE